MQSVVKDESDFVSNVGTKSEVLDSYSGKVKVHYSLLFVVEYKSL